MQSGHNQKQDSKPATSQPQTDQRGTKDSPFVVDTEGHKDTPAETAAKQREKDKEDHIANRTLRSAEITAGATVVLMFAGIGGVIAAVRTLRAIKRQADLMQAQFDQWVELENWRTKKPELDKFIVWVDLVNHTAYPITLDDGYLTISDNAGTPSRTYYLGKKTFLSPNQPHPIDFNLGKGMLPEQLASLSSASFKVKGTFSHRHRITKKEIKQPLEGMLQCERWKSDHKWHATYTAFIHMNPEVQESREGEIQNPTQGTGA